MRDDLKLDVGEPRRQRRPVVEYDYRDEAANLLFQVLRFDPKDFRQRRPDGSGGWSWAVKDVRQVPYRLPELIEALAQDRPVVIVEGEKDADALAQWGIPATCNAGGAGKWRDALNEYFRDAGVVIIPDIDPQAKNPDGTLRFHDPRNEPRVLKAGTKLSDPSLLPGEPSLEKDLDLWRGAASSWGVNLSPVSGFPAIVVPAGFTSVVYDRVPDASDPNGSRLDGPKRDQLPVAMEFLSNFRFLRNTNP
jgi:hypothetical protein